MTLAEFLAPLWSSPQREKCLAVLYYDLHYRNVPALTVEQIREELIRARVPKASKINVADVLNKTRAFVDSAGVIGNRRLWQLTLPGEKHVRSALNPPPSKPEIEHDNVYKKGGGEGRGGALAVPNGPQTERAKV